MIRVRIRENSIAVTGHAQRPEGVPPGQNIICAAVSAITQMLLDGLDNIAGIPIESHVDKGGVTIRWVRLNKAARTLIDAWFLGICGIERSYGEIEII